MGFHPIRVAALAATVSLAALATPVAAQEAQGDDIIVTAQRINRTEVTAGGSVGILGDKKAEDVPFIIKSYNSALILNQQPQTLGQVLENDPSVRTTYGFGNAAEQFIIRGFELAGDDVGIDGLYGIAPRQLIAPELYESVQVLNGASAFLNGAAPGGSGLGGSVNLIPKRAANKPLTRVTANYTSAAHFGGSFDVGRRFGAFGIRINGVAREGDVATKNEFRSTYTFGAGFDYDDGGPLRVSLDLGYQRVQVRGLRPKVELGAGVGVPAVPAADQNYSQPFSYSSMRDIFGIAKVEYDLADNIMLYGSFGARDGSEYGIYDGVTVTNATTGAANGNDLYVPRTDNNEAAQAGIRIKLAGGGMTHEVNFGGSMSWQVNRNAFDFLYNAGFVGYPTNIYNTPVVPVPASAFVGGNLADPATRTRSRLASIFVSDTVGFLDDRVLVTGGVRLQAIRNTTFSYATTGIGPVESYYDQDAITPVIGVVIKPVPGLSLFANRIEGLAQGGSAPIDPLVFNSGATLAPAKTKQYEVGGKLNLGKFDASLAVYQIEKPVSYVIGGIYGAFGQQRNRGIELSVTGEPTEGLRIIAGGSVTEAKLRRNQTASLDGNNAVGVPDYLINANVEWDLPFVPALTLTGRVVQTGEQWVNATNMLKLPSWTRADVGARYVALIADKPMTLRFSVDNVTNERYWSSSFDIFRTFLLQGAPRTYKASVSVDF